LKIPLFLLAFTPIIYHSGSLFPFVFPKVLFIRAILTIFFLIFLCLIFFPKKFEEIFQRIKNYFRQPIFISLILFFLFLTISTIFAPNPSRAFWGDIERGEGMVSWIFYLFFFLFSLSLFSKKDWKIFFTLTLISFLVLFLDQIYSFLTGKSFWSFILKTSFSSKEASFVGNTSFLAAFYLFVIFSSLMLMGEEKKEITIFPTIGKNLISFGLGLIAILAIIGIFITSTMGAIFALLVAFLISMFYLIKNQKFHKKLKIIFLAIIFLGILFSILFLKTHQSPFWKKIPGLSEISQFSFESTSFQTRLSAFYVTKSAINPFEVGILRFLFGWGQEHFLYAFQKFYHPRYLQYDASWYDRAHNKILDVLTMEGFFGLLAYLLIWFFVFKAISKEKDFKKGAALLFFGTSYFLQNLFLFDTVVTYIPFFAYLSLISRSNQEIKEEKIEKKEILILAKIFLIFLFIFNFYFFSMTLISFHQMLNFLPQLSAGRMDLVSSNLDKILKPYTYAQAEIRAHLLDILIPLAKKKEKVTPEALSLLEKVTKAAEESAEKEKWNSKNFALVATAYETIGDLKSAQQNWEKALKNSPKRQDLLYSLALNYYRQEKRDEAIKIAQEIISLDPEIVRDKIYYAVILALTKEKEAFEEATDIIINIFEKPQKIYLFDSDLRIIRNFFNFYLTLFYKEKNEEMFLKTLEKGKTFEEKYEKYLNLSPSNSVRIQQVINSFLKSGWSAIILEE
jgi:O-antigen ligase